MCAILHSLPHYYSITMAWRVAVVAICAVILTSTPRTGAYRAVCQCLDKTERQTEKCFAGMPTSGVISKSWMRHFLPTDLAINNTYMSVGQQEFTEEHYTIEKINEDPDYICRHMDLVVEGLACVKGVVEDACPGLSAREMDFLHRHEAIVHYLCARLPQMDKVCMHTFIHNMESCAMKIFRQNPPPQVDHGPELPDGGKDNGTHNRPEDKEETEEMRDYMCMLGFKANRCARTNALACHEATAEVMFNASLIMTDSDCRLKIEAWAAADDDTRSAASMTCITLLLLPLLAASLVVVWGE